MSTAPPGRNPLTRARVYANRGTWHRALVNGVSYGAYMSAAMTLFQHLNSFTGNLEGTDLLLTAAINFVIFGLIWALIDAKGGLDRTDAPLATRPPEMARPAREAMILGRPSGDPEIDEVARESAEHTLTHGVRPRKAALISVVAAIVAAAAALVTEFTVGGIVLLTPLLWLVVFLLGLSLAVILPIQVAVRRRLRALLDAPPTAGHG